MIERVKEKLEGKKVLFIAAKFYHYTEAVAEKLKSYGADVSFYYERDITMKHAIIANFFPAKVTAQQEKHYKTILDETRNSTFDYLIVIRGYRMPVSFIKALKARNPEIKTLLYQWDVFRLWDADYRYLMPHFDRTLSFDYNDSAELGIPYSPTFYMDEYANIEQGELLFDFIFCTNHTDEKYNFLLNILKYSTEKGYRLRSHLYMSWLKFLKERLKGNKIDYNLISFKRLSRKEYFDLFCRSKVVVDFSGSTQTGLTMRVIDALGSGKRVLTNNKHVVNEPGFNPQQIVIYNPEKLVLPEYIVDDEKFEKKNYSIDKWIDNLFFAN